MSKSTITITFGEGAENHVGMQKIGSLAADAFTCEELHSLWHAHGQCFSKITLP